MCSVVTDCINNVVMLDILAVILSLSLANMHAQMQSFSVEKAQKCFSGWVSAPDPAGGSLQCSPDLVDGFRGGEMG